jgi:transcription elongation factor GreA
MDDISMTEDELRRLQEELRELESAGRARIAAQIKTAREWGDLKENAEYHAAKEAQAHLETRILKLRAQMRAAVVVESAGGDEVTHGSSVEITDTGTGRTQAFKIVSPNDAAPGEGKLSVSSPIAQALLGHGIGDVVQVSAPRGVRELRIDAIS